MKMIVVPPPRADFSQPTAVAFFIVAHLHFRARENEYPCDRGIFCCLLQDSVVGDTPVPIDIGSIGSTHRNRGEFLPLGA